MSFARTVNNLCEQKLKELELSKVFYDRHILCSSFIAGGMITSVAKEEKIKDFDMFITNDFSARTLFYELASRTKLGPVFRLITKADEKNPKLFRGSLATDSNNTIEELIDKFNESCKNNKSNSYSVVPAYLSRNALMLSNGIQLIFRFIGEPEEVFTTFDYEHCKTYWRPNPLGLTLGKVHYSGQCQESLAKNELIYTGNTRFVLSAISRLNKYIKRGWGISPSSLLSLAVSASKINWSDRNTLEEELLGIYGIENSILKKILDNCSKENTVDLDKIIEILGEV